MTEIKNPKQEEGGGEVIKNSAAIRPWSFGFRYCFEFRVYASRIEDRKIHNSRVRLV